MCYKVAWTMWLLRLNMQWDRCVCVCYSLVLVLVASDVVFRDKILFPNHLFIKTFAIFNLCNWLLNQFAIRAIQKEQNTNTTWCNMIQKKTRIIPTKLNCNWTASNWCIDKSIDKHLSIKCYSIHHLFTKKRCVCVCLYAFT